MQHSKARIEPSTCTERSEQGKELGNLLNIVKNILDKKAPSASASVSPNSFNAPGCSNQDLFIAHVCTLSCDQVWHYNIITHAHTIQNIVQFIVRYKLIMFVLLDYVMTLLYGNAITTGTNKYTSHSGIAVNHDVLYLRRRGFASYKNGFQIWKKIPFCT